MKKPFQQISILWAFIIVIFLAACGPKATSLPSDQDISPTPPQNISPIPPRSITPSLTATDNGPTPSPEFTLPDPNPLDVSITVDENTVYQTRYGRAYFTYKERFQINFGYRDPVYYVNAENDYKMVDKPDIELRPITVIDGLPDGLELLVGFSFQPAGLNFDSADISFSFPDAIPEDQIVAFAANADGSDFHFYPHLYKAKDEWITYSYSFLEIDHFSFYGLLTGEAVKIIEAGNKVVPKMLIVQSQHKAASQRKSNPDNCYLKDHWNIMIDKIRTQIIAEPDCKKIRFRDVIILHGLIQQTGCSSQVAKHEAELVNLALFKLLDCIRDPCQRCLNGEDDLWIPFSLYVQSSLLEKMLVVNEETGNLAPLVNPVEFRAAVQKCYEQQGLSYPGVSSEGGADDDNWTPPTPKCP